MKKVVDLSGERRYAVSVLTCPQCGGDKLNEQYGYRTGVVSAGVSEGREQIGWYCRGCGATFDTDEAIIVTEDN